MNSSDENRTAPDLQAPQVPLDLRSELWHSGAAAGAQWAYEELKRGYAHPLTVESARTQRMLIEHAREAFGGRCRGKPRLFIRGFIHGVAQVWRTHGQTSARPPSQPGD